MAEALFVNGFLNYDLDMLVLCLFTKACVGFYVGFNVGLYVGFTLILLWFHVGFIRSRLRDR